MNDMSGKRLLIMGGVKLACNIVNTAKKMGIYTIVTDYLEESPAKKIADESFMVSTTDVDAVVQLTKDIKADGVFTSYVDSILPYYQQVCEKAGFPFYATKEQIQITTDKQKFKQLCQENGLPVIYQYRLDSDFNSEDLDRIMYPVVTKPVDSSGSRGISICWNQGELIVNYEKALAFSKSKKVIVEKYMTGDEVVMYYTIQDGYVSLSAMCDRYTTKEQTGLAQLPTAYIFPSKYLERFQSIDDENIRKMFRSIGMKNGVIFVQSFIQDGRVCLYEMGYRFAGAQGDRIISAINGIDTMEMMIRYALTGNMGGWELKKFDDPNFKKWACKLSPLANTGTIHKIVGLDEIAALPEVIDIIPMKDEGDTITDYGTLDQIVMRIFIVTELKYDLALAINKIYQTLKMLDSDGNNMLLEEFDTRILFEEDKQ